MADGKDKKYFLPLESDPDVFTDLIHALGVSSKLAFTDVLSLDDPDLLAFVPRPVHALILIFPTISDTYTQSKAREEAARPVYAGCGTDEDVVWFKQTIGNACGLYALLHAVTNGPASSNLEPNSTIARILHGCVSLPPPERARYLENCAPLETAHIAAARQGSTAVPNSAKDDVDCHYIAFVASRRTGHLFQMDGDCKGPVDLGPLVPPDGDLLCKPVLDILRKFIEREEGTDLRFNVMALTSDPAGDHSF